MNRVDWLKQWWSHSGRNSEVKKGEKLYSIMCDTLYLLQIDNEYTKWLSHIAEIYTQYWFSCYGYYKIRLKCLASFPLIIKK